MEPADASKAIADIKNNTTMNFEELLNNLEMASGNLQSRRGRFKLTPAMIKTLYRLVDKLKNILNSQLYCTKYID